MENAELGLGLEQSRPANGNTLTRALDILRHPAPRVFILLQLADVLTTIVGLGVGAVELNAFAVLFFTRFGTVPGLIVFKLVAASLILAIFVRAQMRRPEWNLHWLVLYLGNLFYAWVVFNNMQVITDLTRAALR